MESPASVAIRWGTTSRPPEFPDRLAQLPGCPKRKCPAMLTILGPRNSYCDGVSRRSFLKIGMVGLGATSLSLADIFRAEAATSSRASHKAIINIFLGGGPPHQDMWEIKTEAPA